MRVAVLAMGSRGDVYPYLALARGLRAAGHEVRFAAYTNFEQEVRARGSITRPFSATTTR